MQENPNHTTPEPLEGSAGQQQVLEPAHDQEADSPEAPKDTADLTVQPETATDPAPEPPRLTQAEWEERLAIWERKLDARDEIHKRGLPAQLLGLLDFSSRAAMEKGLQIASLAAIGSQAPAAIPLLEAPPQPALVTYRDRVQLYQQDPVAYRTAMQPDKG